MEINSSNEQLTDLARKRLQTSYSTLLGQSSELPDASLTECTSFLAKAFTCSSVNPLTLYKAASCLREGQIREIVQHLIFHPPQHALTLVRLLLIMRGLRGNWELTLQFMQNISIQQLLPLPHRIFTILALLAGNRARNIWDWTPIFQRIFDKSNEEHVITACIVANHVYNGSKEYVLDLIDWEIETEFASNPSFWRELKWAAFARKQAIAVDTDVHLLQPQYQNPHQNATSDPVSYLPPQIGPSASHYVQVCDLLLPLRTKNAEGTLKEATNNMIVNNKSTERPASSALFVLTPNITSVLRQLTAAVAYGMPIVLEGPTGCGKTTLITYLSNITHSIPDQNLFCTTAPSVTFIHMDSSLAESDDDSLSALIGEVVPLPEGRGFHWRHGPIGFTAEKGRWIVFENIGSSTFTKQSAIAALIKQLALLEPGDKLDAPGRGEPITVGTGFRCILTRTIDEQNNEETWAPPAGWEKWVRITANGLDKSDQIDMLQKRYHRVSDCVLRVLNAIEKVTEYTKSNVGHLLPIPSLREAVRICNRLSFTRETTGNLSPEIAYLETVDVLAAACPSHEHLMKLIEIISSSWSVPLTIALDLFFRHKPDLVQDGSYLRIGRASMQLSNHKGLTTSSNLSRTSHTLRLLERLLRSVQNSEHVLLTGETGSGKTSMIQDVASLLGKKLYVVNMSRQSELTDLVGGFKPVDISVSISLLVKKFEELFGQCMPRNKNERFLDAVQKASRSSQHHTRALRLMKGALNAIPNNARNKSTTATKWKDVSEQIDEMQSVLLPSSNVHAVKSSSSFKNVEDSNQRPKKRPRVSGDLRANDNSQDVPSTAVPPQSTRRMDFKFSEGVLVQAMREGNWILFDEINLAPTELLERLVAVLERGEISIGNEKAELVSKAPGFTVFGAMNPPTDVGKKPLPSVLRNKFSEISVPDLTDTEEIAVITLHKVFGSSNSATSTSTARDKEEQIALDVAKFFTTCHNLSVTGQLEDCTGKSLRFSLRTLSRMLDFAAGTIYHLKTGYKGIRRLLYEGAMLAFATPLLGEYREKVVGLAASILLGKKAGVTPKLRLLSEQIMDPSKSQSNICIEGFLVEKNPKPKEDIGQKPEKFVISSTVRRTLCDVCRALMFGAPKLPILVQGPTATGKTSLIRYLADITGNKLTRINNHEHTELSEYLGSYTSTPDGSLVFQEGPLVRAVRKGEWIVLDELNLAPPDVLEALNRLLDDNREIFLPDTSEVVKAAKGFRLFATQNPPGVYGGRKELSKAFRSRFIEVQVGDLPDDDLLTILEARECIPASFAKKMILVMRELQIRRRATGLFSGREGFITVRDLFRWASRQPRTKEELAVHGFYLLGERARRKAEKDIIREVIVKETNVSLDILSDISLYSFETRSLSKSAAEECLDVSLEKLKVTRQHVINSCEANDIVLTPHMKRLIVLVIHCVANSEPVLLVGVTGGGKTSCCAAICEAIGVNLRTINCHKNTEASDILGAYRPTRRNSESKALFEWSDGPLILSMKEGGVFLIDEVNMAEDAVVERLNSVLEPQRTLLLSEKGITASKGIGETKADPEFIVANGMFRLMATMNPGGDFGKRELSPALRNRFTELWVPGPSVLEDYSPLVLRTLNIKESNTSSPKMAYRLIHSFLERYLVEVSKRNESSLEAAKVSSCLGQSEFSISLRDIKTWCAFIRDVLRSDILDEESAVLHGIRMTLLDGLTVGSTSAGDKEIEAFLWGMIVALASDKARERKEEFTFSEKKSLQLKLYTTENPQRCIEVGPFSLQRIKSYEEPRGYSYSFEADCTTRNTGRLLRAMSLQSRPILLEGPPGCGKTSLVQAIASLGGFDFIRVNLSEATELADLVGADAPSEEPGQFGFREGPLLRALRNGSWLLLDELNLASQSVLEGLNSVLDHRKCMFVPETKEEVYAHPNFKVFGAQNPPSDGGGRRGLPQSFLNRFSKVSVEAPCEEDLYAIARDTNPALPEGTTSRIITVLRNIRKKLHAEGNSCATLGLRDVLRWCDLLTFMNSRMNNCWKSSEEVSSNLLCVSFDVVILQGFGVEDQRKVARQCFEEVFQIQWIANTYVPSICSLDDMLRIGEASIKKNGFSRWQALSPVEDSILVSQNRELQALALAIQINWPAILVPSSTAECLLENKRRVQTMATLFGKELTIIQGSSLTDSDDFVGGYYQQDTFRSLRRASQRIEWLMERALIDVLKKHSMESCERESVTEMQGCHMAVKNLMNTSAIERGAFETSSKGSDILLRIIQLSQDIFDPLDSVSMIAVQDIKQCKNDLDEACGLISTGRFATFQWRKSELLQAIERGCWILIEDADECSPAILDRLNPVFERAAISVRDGETAAQSMQTKEIVLAEAPSKNDGSPETLNPHPEFRMFFSLSTNAMNKDNLGLSPALLDRSLKVTTTGGNSRFEKRQAICSKGLADVDVPALVTNSQEEVSNFVFRDPSSMAEKMRFFVASQEQSNEYVNIPDVNHGQSRILAKCVTLKGLSQGTIPATGASDLSGSMMEARIDRDICGLRYLKATPLIEGLSSDAYQLNLNELGTNVILFSGDQSELIKSIKDFRVGLTHSGAEAFLLGAVSKKDIQLRLTALNNLGKSSENNSISCEHENASRGTALLNQLDAEGNLTSIGGPVPLDPVSALDFGSTNYWPHVQGHQVLQQAQRQAKHIRFEFFCIFALRKAWRETLEGDHSPSTSALKFSLARRASELWKKTGDSHDLQVELPVVLCYDIVNLFVSNLDSIKECLASTDGWTHPGELAWINIVLIVAHMCKLLNSSSSSPAKFVAGLSIFISATGNLPCPYPSSIAEELSMTIEKVEQLITTVSDTRDMSSVLLLPRTSTAFDIERNVYTKMIQLRQHATFEQIDAAIRGLASIRIGSFTENEKLLDSFQKLPSSLVSQKVSPFQESGTSHWSRLGVAEVLARVESILLTGSDILSFLENWRAEGPELLYRAKVVSNLSLDTIVTLQHLKWAAEIVLRGSPAAEADKYRLLQDNILLTNLIRERSTLLADDLKKNDDAHPNNGRGIVSRSLWRVADDTVSLWNVGRFRADSPVATLSLGCTTSTGIESENRVKLLQRLVKYIHDQKYGNVPNGNSPNRSCSWTALEVLIKEATEEGSAVISDRDFALATGVQKALASLRSSSHSKEPDIGNSIITYEFSEAQIWILVSLIGLLHYQDELQKLMGVDPAEVASEIGVVSEADCFSWFTRSISFATISQYRLGGDDPGDSPLILQINEFVNRKKALIRLARQLSFERPVNKAKLAMYQASVENIISTMEQSILSTKLLEHLSCHSSIDKLQMTLEEVQVLHSSCMTVVRQNKIDGEFSHFRDISHNFILGITCMQYGLLLASKVCQKQIALKQTATKSRIMLLNDLSKFPRMVSSQALSIVQVIKTCIEGNVTGDLLLRIFGLHLSYLTAVPHPAYEEMSGALSLVVSLWKQKAMMDEEENEKKDAFFILREANAKSELPGSEWIEDDPQTTERDFTDTFNFISTEDEEELLGVSSESSTTSTEPFYPNKDTNSPVVGKFQADEFWKLHNMVFPPETSALMEAHSQDLAVLRMQSLHYLSPQLFKLCDNSEVVVDDLETVLHFIASGLTLQKLQSGVPSNVSLESSSQEKKTSFNFYKEGNPVELVEASSRLERFYNKISSLQDSFFENAPHPVLQEVSDSVIRVTSYCKFSTPLSIIVLGLENILRKVDEWRRIFATSAMRMDSEIADIARLVAKWRKMEMNSWSYLLEERFIRFEQRAQNWFLLLYDAVMSRGVEQNSSMQNTHNEVISLMDQFLRSSARGELSTRVKMVSSLANHLNTIYGDERKELQPLINHLRGIVSFYSLYTDPLGALLKKKMNDVREKLKEFTTLVSWNYTSELGSSQKMSKEYDKNLEYYRLKSAAERTKRRLHKLCQEVDNELKIPVYSFIVEQNSSIGFSSLFESSNSLESFSENKDRFCISKSIRALQIGDTKLDESFNTTSVLETLPQGTKNIFARILEFGAIIQHSDNSLSDRAVSFSSTNIQTNITRSQLIRDSSQDVQLKKRSLVDLLHLLKQAGLSPYSKNEEQDSNNLSTFLSSLSPSINEEYKLSESSLYMTGILHARRLHEVSDSRERNKDVTNQEAKAMSNYIYHLLRQAYIEREAMSNVTSQIQEIRSIARAMENIQPYAKSEAKLVWTPTRWDKLCFSETKLKDACYDLKVCQVTLREAMNSVDKSDEKIDLYSRSRRVSSKTNIRTGQQLLELLEIGITSISQFLSGPDLPRLSTEQVRSFVKLDATFSRRAEEKLKKLSSLADDITTTLETAKKISETNVVVKTIAPVQCFVQNAITSLSAELEDDSQLQPLETVIPVMRESIDKLLKKTQISVQRSLEWVGVRIADTPGNTSTEENITCNETQDNASILRDSHLKTVSFSSSLQLEQVVHLLHEISDLNTRVDLSGGAITSAMYEELTSLEQTLGSVLHVYLNSIILPCFQRALHHHSAVLSLQISLSAFFIGLCKEGYCRPHPECDSQDENEMDVEGTGFGDAGDGDMSGAKNVSDEIEDEEQLLGLKNNTTQDNQEQEAPENDDEDGFDMSTDFDGQLQKTKKVNEEDENDTEEQNEEKQLSFEDGTGDDIIDEKLWDGEKNPESNQKPKTSSDTKQELPDQKTDNLDLAAKDSNEDFNEKEKQGDQQKNHEEDESHKDIQNDELSEVHDETVNDEEDEDENEEQKNLDTKDRKGGDKMDLGDPSQIDESNENNENDANADEENGQQQRDENDVPTNEGDTEMNNENDEVMLGTEGEAPGNEMNENDQTMHENDHENSDEIPQDLNLESEEKVDNTGSDIDAEQGDIRPEDLDDKNLGDFSDNENDNENQQNTTAEDPEVNENEGENNNTTEKIGMGTEDEDNTATAREHTAYDLEAGTATTNQPQSTSNETGAFSAQGAADVQSATDQSEQPEDRSESKGAAGSKPQERTEENAEKLEESSMEKYAQSTGYKQEEWERKESTEANPFRSTAEELIVDLERMLNVLDAENNDISKDETNDNEKPTKGGMWEFNHNEEGMCAMGDATEEQQRPVPEDETMNEDETAEAQPSRSDDKKTIEVHGDVEHNDSIMTDKGIEIDETVDNEDDTEAKQKESNTAHDDGTENNDSVKNDERKYNNQISRREDENDDMEVDNTLIEEMKPSKSGKIEISMEVAKQKWRSLERQTGRQARILCEQLQLILEATEAKGLRSGYRSGRRLDMRRVIEYVASDFRRDRIWRRRSALTSRSYDVMVCVDDSSSMRTCGAAEAALQAIGILGGALARLEVGRVGVASFGETSKIVRNLDEALPISMDSGGKLMKEFTFEQNRTNIVSLLKLLKEELNSEDRRLALIVSDGRIEDREEVRRQVRGLKDQGVLVALIIVDADHKEGSVMSLRRVEYGHGGEIQVKPYLDEFPMEFYAVVEDINQVSIVLGDAMRQWVEMMNLQ